jgi:hypothetical protein
VIFPSLPPHSWDDRHAPSSQALQNHNVYALNHKVNIKQKLIKFKEKDESKIIFVD